MAEAIRIEALPDKTIALFSAGSPGDDRARVLHLLSPAGDEQLTARGMLPAEVVTGDGHVGQIFSIALDSSGKTAALAVGWWDQLGKSHNAAVVATRGSTGGWRTVSHFEYPGALRETLFAPGNDRLLVLTTLPATRRAGDRPTPMVTVFTLDGAVAAELAPVPAGEELSARAPKWTRSRLQALDGGRFAWLDLASGMAHVFAVENGSAREVARREIAPGLSAEEELLFCSLVGNGEGDRLVGVRRKEGRGRFETKLTRVSAAGATLDSWATAAPWRQVRANGDVVEGVVFVKSDGPRLEVRAIELQARVP